jgi:phosphoglycerol transferase MdoB-like AlkP superfamily enzyme
MKTRFPGSDDAAKFRNAASYTDESLKKYFASVKEKPWYANTVFILVADHGHLLPRKRAFEDPASHHIPLLVFGPALNNSYHGKKIDVIGSQHDLPATLLHQLGLHAEKYLFSNDLLDPNRTSFAYFNLDDAFGWITPSQQIVYYPSRNELQHQYTRPLPLSDSTVLQNGKNYLQVLYKQFLDL